MGPKTNQTRKRTRNVDETKPTPKAVRQDAKNDIPVLAIHVQKPLQIHFKSGSLSPGIRER